jgi:hypothetical protein
LLPDFAEKPVKQALAIAGIKDQLLAEVDNTFIIDVEDKAELQFADGHIGDTGLIPARNPIDQRK